MDRGYHFGSYHVNGRVYVVRVNSDKLDFEQYKLRVEKGLN
jgi:hypothetical protein